MFLNSTVAGPVGASSVSPLLCQVEVPTRRHCAPHQTASAGAIETVSAPALWYAALAVVSVSLAIVTTCGSGVIQLASGRNSIDELPMGMPLSLVWLSRHTVVP